VKYLKYKYFAHIFAGFTGLEIGFGHWKRAIGMFVFVILAHVMSHRARECKCPPSV
jgi:uncharacterized membrane protein YhiD involved in acid resistance